MEIEKATIRQRRLAAGLTQAELARRVGVQTSQVSRWERGVAEPSARHARRLARALQPGDRDPAASEPQSLGPAGDVDALD